MLEMNLRPHSRMDSTPISWKSILRLTTDRSLPITSQFPICKFIRYLRSGHLNSKSKINNQTIQEEDPSIHNEEQMVEVVYDPVMNCYFDPTTNQYYELNEWYLQ
jgi:hypothetical protein